jgi:spore germination protein GerM
MAGRRKKKKTNIAATCWLLTLLVLIAVFVVKHNDIRTVLAETDFFGKVFGTDPAFVTKAVTPTPAPAAVPAAVTPPAQSAAVSPAPVTVAITDPALVAATEALTAAAAALAANAAATPSPAGTTSSSTNSANSPTVNSSALSPAAAATTPATTTVSLFFIRVDEDGLLARREIKRSFPKNDAPLQSAIQSLLLGPALPESERGLQTLIPSGTRLQSIHLENGVAALSFSEEFEANRYGGEGYLGQLEQIVYTATAFPTVNAVQFLIDGEKREYIGGEGVWIGSPLGRGSFK